MAYSSTSTFTSIVALHARQQLIAFASASHPRCGAASPARCLWLRDPYAAVAVRDACCCRRRCRCRAGGGTGGLGAGGGGGGARSLRVLSSTGWLFTSTANLIALSVSPVLLGVTEGPVVAAAPRPRPGEIAISENTALTHRHPSRDLFVVAHNAPPCEVHCQAPTSDEIGSERLVMKKSEWDAFASYAAHGRWMMPLGTDDRSVMMAIDLEAPDPSATATRVRLPWAVETIVVSKCFPSEALLLACGPDDSVIIVALMDVERTVASKSLAVVSETRVPREDTKVEEGIVLFGGLTLPPEALHLRKKKSYNYTGTGGGDDVAVICLRGNVVVHVEMPSGKWRVIRVTHRGKCSMLQVDCSLFCLQFYCEATRMHTVELWDAGNTTGPVRTMEFEEQGCVACCVPGLLP
ncbi:hypothetical protein Pelo_18492 [Pelomyxa schiedti]|nr:hypothetical protein Pelo_18492 [Pelomyxa schiedti]